MKTKISNYILLGLLAWAGAQLVSCKKNELEVGTPTTRKISTIKDPETSITGGNMGDWIAIHGTNLAAPESVWFNDVEVDLEEVYHEDDILYLQVPIKMPVDITDKIVIKTKGGETSFDFKVDIPDLELTGMFNEYTLPGDTIRIYGRFLSLYEVDSENSVVAFGDRETPVISATDTYITAKVPADVPSNVKVALINNKYDATAICPGYYQDKNHVITSFDDDFPYASATGQQWVGAWSNPKPTSGKYIRFEVDQQTYPNGLGWFYLFENSYNYTQDMIQHPENYELKFELNMALPIQRTNFFIYYYWAVAPSPMGGETFSVQTLGRWQTIAIPLEKIIPMGDDGTSTAFSLNMRVENFAPVERVAMYFDNFRIYKKGD